MGFVANGGPCTAARVIAGSAFYKGFRGGLALGAFTLGAFATDVALVSSLGLFFRALEISSWCYAAAAIGSLAAGLWTIARPPAHSCSLGVDRAGATETSTVLLPAIAGIGSALLLGACCAPFVLAAAATAGIALNPLSIALAYGSAHAGLPLILSLCSRGAEKHFMRAGALDAIVSIEAGLFIACAIYFGILA